MHRFARLIPLLGAAVLLASACGGEQAAPSASALDSAATDQDSSTDVPLAEVLRQDRFRVFSTMLDSAGLLPALQRGGPYTVFAATSPGIDNMPEGLVSELLLPENRDRLRQVMAYHIHRGQLSKDSLRGATSVSTLAGQPLPVAAEGGRLLVGENRLSEYTLAASNGRLFAFDALAMPPVGGPPAESITLPSFQDTLGADFGTGGGTAPGDGGSESSDGNSGGTGN